MELANSTIAQMMRIFTINKQGKWTNQLRKIEHAFNFAYNQDLNGQSLFENQFGHTPTFSPKEDNKPSKYPGVDNYLRQVRIDNRAAWGVLTIAWY